MKTPFLILATLLLLTSCSKKETTNVSLTSPNNSIELVFDVANTEAFYEIKFNNKQVINKSKLGFEFKNQPALTNNFIITGVETSTGDEVWEQVWGEIKEVKDNYNLALVHLQEKDGLKRKLNITFKVYNDGVGFSYQIPDQPGIDSLFITDEITEFNLAQDYSTWFMPANFSSYELLYQNKPAGEVESANTPVTFESSDQTIFVSIHEANLTNYAGMTLKKKAGSDLSFKADLVPWPDGIKVKAEAPMNTPWRTIQIAGSAGELIESTLILNLNEPNKLEDVSWIKPTKYIGIWWGMHLGTQTWTLGERHGATTLNMKKYIDFAAANNIQSVLAEGWSTGWEKWGQARAFDFVTPYEDFDLKEIVDYAKKRGLIL